MTDAMGAQGPADLELRHTSAPKASTVLADELRASIVRQKLKPGSPFPSEAQIIAQSQKSRATVREALRLLESEGLIVSRRGPGGGLRVGQPDPRSVVRSLAVHFALSEATLADLFAFRRLVEKEAAHLAALNVTPGQLERLQAAVAEPARPLPEMIDFHSLVAEATGNEFFRVMLELVVSLANWHTPDEGFEGHELDPARAAHAKVVTRISEGDAEGAALAMDAHLGAFEQIVRERGHIDRPVIRAASSSWG